MNESNYIDFFVSSLLNIIRAMAEMECITKEAVTQSPVHVSQGLAVYIGITGSKQGRVILDTSRETALKLSEGFNCEKGLTDEVVFNTMAEFANMVAGHGISQIKNLQKYRDLMLTPPSIFIGNEISISSHKIRSISVEIETPVGLINISIGFEG